MLRMPLFCAEAARTRHSLVDFTVEKRFQKAVQGMLDKQLDNEKAGEGEELDAMMGDLTDFRHDVLDSDEDEGEDGTPG